MAHKMLLHDAGEERIPILLMSGREDLPRLPPKWERRTFCESPPQRGGSWRCSTGRCRNTAPQRLPKTRHACASPEATASPSPESDASSALFSGGAPATKAA
jgi:hypothetical protein